MKKTYIGRVLGYEMQRAGLTQSALADHAAVPQSTISQIIGTDVRIAPLSLNALTHCWPTPEANGRVLIAHLRDEIHRAGHDPENALDIRWPSGHRATTMAERSMEVIRRHIADPEIAAFIHSIAVLLRRAEKYEKRASKEITPHPISEQPGLAAESHGPDYLAKK